jgi:hypothetical protein
MYAGAKRIDRLRPISSAVVRVGRTQLTLDPDYGCHDYCKGTDMTTPPPALWSCTDYLPCLLKERGPAKPFPKGGGAMYLGIIVVGPLLVNTARLDGGGGHTIIKLIMTVDQLLNTKVGIEGSQLTIPCR